MAGPPGERVIVEGPAHPACPGAIGTVMAPPPHLTVTHVTRSQRSRSDKALGARSYCKFLP